MTDKQKPSKEGAESSLRWAGEEVPAGTKGPGHPEFGKQNLEIARIRRAIDLDAFADIKQTLPI